MKIKYTNCWIFRTFVYTWLNLIIWVTQLLQIEARAGMLNPWHTKPFEGTRKIKIVILYYIPITNDETN